MPAPHPSQGESIQLSRNSGLISDQSKTEKSLRTKKPKLQRQLDELAHKKIVHYSVLLSAWIDTKMERDKTLVFLSATAIGLLVTILTTVKVNSIFEIFAYAAALTSFLVTIFSSLTIYQLNSEHLEDAIRGATDKDPRLEKHDKWSFRSFIIGATFTLMVGVMSASFRLYELKENKVSKNNQTTQNPEKSTVNRKSFNGIGNLNPHNSQQTKQTQDKPKEDQPNKEKPDTNNTAENKKTD